MVSSKQRTDHLELVEEEGLHEVLAIERQVQSILRDAEAEAQRIIATAQQQTNELKAAAEAEARREAEQLMTKAAEETRHEIETLLAEAQHHAEEWDQHARACFEDALAFVLRLVTLSEAK